MDTSKKSNNICFFCDSFVRDYMPFRVNTNASHQRDNVRKYIVKLSKSHFVALSKETWFIIFFSNAFFLAVHFRLICLHSGVLNWIGSFIIICFRWWSTFCFDVSVCLDISAVYLLFFLFFFFCYHGFKWKIKTPDKDICVWSLLTHGTGQRD